jgi:hypothetical protein
MRTHGIETAVFQCYVMISRFIIVFSVAWLMLGCASLDSHMPTLRIAAAEKCTDQTMLAKVAVEDENPYVREAAIKNSNLTDQAVLAKVAVEDKNRQVSYAAFKRLTEQAALAKVAVEHKDSYVRNDAVKKLTDQATLAKVAVKDRMFTVRRAAFSRLTDQAMLAKVALEGEDSSICESAVKMLTDQAVLAKLAWTARWHSVSKAAIANLDDQMTLTRLALDQYLYESIRSAAAAKVQDRTPLRLVGKENPVKRRIFEKFARERNCEEQYRDIEGITNRNILSMLMFHWYGNTGALARLRLFLTDPEVQRHLGETDVAISHGSVQGPQNHGLSITGDSVTITVRGGRLAAPISHSWRVKFFGTYLLDWDEYHHHIPVKIAVEELAGKLLENVSSQAAAELLWIIDIGNKTPKIRQAAVTRLTDQELLATITVHEKDLEVNLRRFRSDN